MAIKYSEAGFRISGVAKASSNKSAVDAVFSPGKYSFSTHRKIVERYSVIVLANDVVYDLHPHFARHGQTEHGAFIKHLLEKFPLIAPRTA